MSNFDLTVPAVNARPGPGQTSPARVRTDVVGFVGVGGPRHRHEAKRIDDWTSYVATYLRDDAGQALDEPPGARLAEAVREFFANGGARCVVVNIGAQIDSTNTDPLVADMLGIPDEPPTELAGLPVRPIGLELLLTMPEVSLVILPELHARVPVEGVAGSERPLFSNPELLTLQRLFLNRLAQPRERWRVFTLLEPPIEADALAALRWRDALGDHGYAALYWPWVVVEDGAEAPTHTLPPSFAVAGVYARVDLACGPHRPPANERLRDVVVLTEQVEDRVQADLYAGGVNLLRAFPGFGIHVWGARTLLWDPYASPRPELNPLSFVNARRCLTAIERNAEHIAQRSGSAAQRSDALASMRLTRELRAQLLAAYESGALAGDTPEQAFFVRSCADSSAAEDELVCKIGVALAAPAEFIVFRLIRRQGMIEIEEAGPSRAS
ncbi:Phage tail sheath protein [Enhygromyxa salina]|uniref:Phage tail sheath protein n=1 Tax=Enhygromyxa salina TaxID=215803 RepID=A0A2S9YGG6_9BACT|nr:phage tail sheath subtilisin-like domain-containing protein [Enhygromyxa salina]PRQ04198.1 Phage tail sheath protein [Enhygromyxa salina]